MKFLWRILGVTLFNFTFVKRQWMWIAQEAMFAISIAMLAYGWGGYAVIRSTIPVYIMISVWGFGANLVAQTVGYDRISREWERMIASRLTVFEYFIGVVLGTTPFILSPIAILTPIAIALDLGLKTIAIALLVSPIAMALGAFLSLAIVLRIKNPMNISAITNPLVIATTFLPPVLYPLAILPEPLRIASIAIPTVALAEITRFMSIGTCTTSLELSITSTAIWLIATAIAMIKVLRWGLEP